MEQGKRRAIMGASSGAHSLSKIGGIPSGPGGLEVSSRSRAWRTFLVVKEGGASIEEEQGNEGTEEGGIIVELDAKQSAKISAFSGAEQDRLPDRFIIGGNEVEQKLRPTALARLQNERLPVGVLDNLSALRRTKLSFALSMVLVQALRART